MKVFHIPIILISYLLLIFHPIYQANETFPFKTFIFYDRKNNDKAFLKMSPKSVKIIVIKSEGLSHNQIQKKFLFEILR